MYKVFVENRPIIICEKNTFPLDSIILFAEKVKTIDKDVFPLFEKNSPKTPIIILSQNATVEFNRLFAKHSLLIAAGGIVRKGEEYLFIKRFGKWDIPKGKLEKLENPEIGAIREIEEECGISNPIIERFICETYHTYRDTYKGKNKLTLKKTFWYGLTYSGEEELLPQVQEGITKAKWFKISKLEKIRLNTYASILEVIDIYFGEELIPLPKKRKI